MSTRTHELMGVLSRTYDQSCSLKKLRPFLLLPVGICVLLVTYIYQVHTNCICVTGKSNSKKGRNFFDEQDWLLNGTSSVFLSSEVEREDV